MFPRLTAYITDTEPDDPEGARSLIVHTLCQYVGLLPPNESAAAMAIVVPVLMTRATTEGEGIYQETSTRLLGLAATRQDAFKAVVADMQNAQRIFLEKVITDGQQYGSQSAQAAVGSAGQPSITLKMEFGG